MSYSCYLLLNRREMASLNCPGIGLFRDDGKIDDYTFVQGVKRGNFRLHPIGPLGLSEGCITLQHPIQFNYLRDRLLESGATLNIPGSQLKAYGTIKVY